MESYEIAVREMLLLRKGETEVQSSQYFSFLIRKVMQNFKEVRKLGEG